MRQIGPSLMLAVLGAACATSPTERRQFIVVSDGQMATLGAQSFEQMKQERAIERDPAIDAYVQCVADTVAATVPGEAGQVAWDVVVFRDDSANAFALPGGKVGVHTGLLVVADTPAQLAAVLGHEVGHVVARHSHERVSQALALEGGLALANALAGDMDERQRGLLLGALGVGAQVGVMLPYSRAHELEADELGLEYMARAGFDPREAVTLWENMQRARGAAPPELLSTHPAPRSRIERLHVLLPGALVTYDAARRAGRRPTCRTP